MPTSSSFANGVPLPLLKEDERAPAAIKRIKQQSSAVDFGQGDFIFHQGQGAAGVYDLCSGTAKVFKTTDEGGVHIVRLVQAGQLLGHHAVLLGAPHGAAAVALTDVRTRFIPRDDFVAVLRQAPDLSLRLLRALSSEVRGHEHQLLSLSHHTVAQRVADTLLTMEARHGTDADGALALSLSRQDLATHVGAATETTVRTLTNLKTRNLIRTSGRRIWLRDRKRLRRMLDCPAQA